MSEPSTDLTIPPHLLNPITGELVATANLDQVVQNLDQLREMRRRIGDVFADFAAVVIEASRQRGKRTLTAGGFDIEITGGWELDWDTDVLEELRAAGMTEERFNELVVPTLTYKVNARVANQISAANPVYKAIIDRARKRIPKRQYVNFK